MIASCRDHNHAANRLCCRRGHGERIRRAGPVPGGAASGEDLGVLGRLSLQPSRSSARARSAEFGSSGVRDGSSAVAPRHETRAQVKTFGVFNEGKGSGKKKGLALPSVPAPPNPFAAPAPAPAPAPA